MAGKNGMTLEEMDEKIEAEIRAAVFRREHELKQEKQEDRATTVNVEVLGGMTEHVSAGEIEEIDREVRTRLKKTGAGDQEIETAIRDAVFKKEKQIERGKRQASDAAANVKALQEMTDIVSDEEIEKIDGQIRARYKNLPKNAKELEAKIREAVFRREDEIERGRKRATNAKINVEVLEDMTDLVPDREIEQIDREIRARYKEAREGSGGIMGEYRQRIFSEEQEKLHEEEQEILDKEHEKERGRTKKEKLKSRIEKANRKAPKVIVHHWEDGEELVIQPTSVLLEIIPNLRIVIHRIIYSIILGYFISDNAFLQFEVTSEIMLYLDSLTAGAGHLIPESYPRFVFKVLILFPLVNFLIILIFLVDFLLRSRAVHLFVGKNELYKLRFAGWFYRKSYVGKKEELNIKIRNATLPGFFVPFIYIDSKKVIGFYLISQNDSRIIENFCKEAGIEFERDQEDQ